MIYKQPAIYKQGIDENEISSFITNWQDVTNEFSLNDSNWILAYGKILKNEALKQIKFSIRIDLITPQAMGQYSLIEKNDILSFDYIFESSISSLCPAYIDDDYDRRPRGFCMVWNDEHTINAQIFNPSDKSQLSAFSITTTLIYK